MPLRLHAFLVMLKVTICFMLYTISFATTGRAAEIAGWNGLQNNDGETPFFILTPAHAEVVDTAKTESTERRERNHPSGPENTGVSQLPAAAIPAFPGAEGYGAMAQGGRGGRVIEVTNLNDSGPGSLRVAVTAGGPRIVVFRVGGTIELQSDLVIRGEDQAYLTIAGQTAPGGGILLKNYGFHIVDTHDIVVRYLRIRPGQWDFHNVWVYGILIYGYHSSAHDIIFDHVSESWHVDDNAIWGNVWNVTLQWSIFAEGTLNANATQYEKAEKRGHALMWGPSNQVNHLSLHHNLLMHNFYRNPGMGGGEHQFINNVIYNPGWLATHTGQYGQAYPVVVDFIGNYYKSGLDTRAGIKEISFEETHDPSLIKLYLKDNFGWSYDPNNPHALVQSLNYNKRMALLAPGPAVPVTIHGYNEAKNLVISNVGATLPRRDAVDERLINELNTGTGRLDKGSDWPFIANGTPPADSDHDGMPDEWENAHGLDPQNAADGNQDADGDGYLNIEEFLNELAGDNDTFPPLIATLNADKVSGQAPLAVQFSGSASGGKAPYSFEWDFGDGGISNAQNPSHTYDQANSYTAKLTVTDSEDKQASTSLVITVAASIGNAPSVVGVRLTEVNQLADISVINPGNWYDLYLYVDDPQGWNNIFFADIWLSHESNNEGTISNRGGRYFAINNYVMSYSIVGSTIWAKETDGTTTWTQITGKLGLYVDDDNNEYEQNSIQKWAKARIKLLANAQTGNWTINAYVIDKERHLSSLFQKNIRVSTTIDQTPPSPPQNVKVSSGPP